MEMCMPKIRVNHKVCTGCRICELSCSSISSSILNPENAKIRIFKNEEEGIDKPLLWRQCKNAKCAEICPEKAIELNPETLVWQIDYQLCSGCKLCISACPFQAIFLGLSEEPIKCDQCKGEKPACVEACPTGALVVDQTV